MGGSISKSPLERRNTVLRRSQKKHLVQSDAQIEKLLKDAIKFKGTSQDENYTRLKHKIEECRKELSRKAKDIIPQVRNLHTRAVEKVNQAESILEAKLQENIEKANQTKPDKQEDEEVSNIITPTPDQQQKDLEHNNNQEVIIEELERQRDGLSSPASSIRGATNEEYNLINSTDQRKTVELSFIKIESDISIEDLSRSPKDKRRSVMKYGVHVLPTLNNEMSPRGSIASPRSSLSSKPSIGSPRLSYKQSFASANVDNIMSEIEKNVGAIEDEISQFNGRKDGLHYNNLKERLFGNLDRLSTLPDKTDATSMKLKRYIESCLSFLDERAEEAEDDEVFLPGSVITSQSQRTANGYKITSI